MRLTMIKFRVTHRDGRPDRWMVEPVLTGDRGLKDERALEHARRVAVSITGTAHDVQVLRPHESGAYDLEFFTREVQS